MKKNMSSLDRSLRIVLALVFIGLFVMKIITGVLGIVLVALAVIFLFTSFVSFCPIYRIFGVSTCPVEK